MRGPRPSLALLRDGDEVLAGDVTTQDGKHFHGIGRLVEGFLALADGGFSNAPICNDLLHGGEVEIKLADVLGLEKDPPLISMMK